VTFFFLQLFQLCPCHSLHKQSPELPHHPSSTNNPYYDSLAFLQITGSASTLRCIAYILASRVLSADPTQANLNPLGVATGTHNIAYHFSAPEQLEAQQRVSLWPLGSIPASTRTATTRLATPSWTHGNRLEGPARPLWEAKRKQFPEFHSQDHTTQSRRLLLPILDPAKKEEKKSRTGRSSLILLHPADEQTPLISVDISFRVLQHSTRNKEQTAKKPCFLISPRCGASARLRSLSVILSRLPCLIWRGGK
jgi:hypothetical protein